MRGHGGIARDPVPAYWAAFVVIGISLSITGPALSTLRANVGATLGGIGVVFVAQSVGYLAGSLGAGRGYDAGWGHRLLAGAMVVIAVAMLAMPWVSSLVVLMAVCAVVGLASSICDVGGNSLVIWVRQGDVGPAMNVLHLCFGLGALSTPLLVAVDLRLACLVESVLALGVAAFVLRFESPSQPHAAHTTGTLPGRRVLFTLMVFFIVYVGVELSFAGWIHTYAEEIHLGGARAAAALTAVFWLSFCVGRVLAAVIAPRMASGSLILGSCVVSLAAAAAMALWGPRAWVVWAATSVFGLGIASQFPMMITYADERLKLSSAATAWFVTGAGLGGLSLPWLVGQVFDRHGARAMPVMATLFSSVALVWFGVVAVVLRGHGARHGARQPSAAAAG